MKNVTKLTPEILKKIISEEKKKLNEKRNRKNDDRVAEAYLKCIKLLKEHQSKKNRDLKKIEKIKTVLKAKLMRRL